MARFEMVNVWVSSGVQSGFVSAGGWDAFVADGLDQIVSTLKSRGLRNQVDRLAIIAHGDIAGNVQLKPPLTYDTVSNYRFQLNALRDYLRPEAPVLFLACQCAGGQQGDRLLQEISAIIAGSPVIGFVCPNQVFAGQVGTYHVYAPLPDKKTDRDDEWSPWAKWATYGLITREPLYELATFQSKDPTGKKRCGSSSCPGHAKVGDQCNPYKRRSWPEWVH
jgi:hypothetical protein